MNAKDAWSMRERGLLLPIGIDYDDKQVGKIAERQRQLMDEMDELDRELKRLRNLKH